MITLLLGMMFIETKNSPSLILNSIFIVIIIINLIFLIYWLVLLYPAVYPQVVAVINVIKDRLGIKLNLKDSGTPETSRRTKY